LEWWEKGEGVENGNCNLGTRKRGSLRKACATTGETTMVEGQRGGDVSGFGARSKKKKGEDN